MWVGGALCGCACMWVNNVIYYALLSGISGIYRARDTTHKCCHKFSTAPLRSSTVAGGWAQQGGEEAHAAHVATAARHRGRLLRCGLR